MTTYSALVTLKMVFSTHLHYYGAALPPERLKILEFGYKEMKSFQDFLDRLSSRSRKRMHASLEQVTRELLQFGESTIELGEKVDSLMETLKKTKEEYYNNYSLLENEEEAAVSSSSSMIGLHDERSELKEALMDGFVNAPFFLLHGMPGIGKTTLAREVFEDLDISEWFTCRAWVTVGLDRKPEEVKQVVLAQLNPDDEMVMGGEEEERLTEILRCKRWLIVFDDVWDNCKFEDYWSEFMRGAYEESRSRCMVTTRINHLDYSRIAEDWHVFEKRLLSREESWDLLRHEGFVGGLCPPELEDAGKKIADRCDGLPLTIVKVADALSKGDESLWIKVAAQRKHQLFIDVYDQISKVLYPSYKELRDELKLCFLYMGVFPLKYKIPRTKLINLWIVEEIFDPTMKHYDLEYLRCLDLCSLVMVYQKSSTYFKYPLVQGISTCGLHSSWWHFCQREARKKNFFHVIDCPEDGIKEDIKGQGRLSIHNNVLFALKDVYNSMEENCASTAQSLLCFGPYHQYQVPICFGLKLIQRLDALNIRFYDFPLEVVELVKLRYLALTCNGKLPPSISKLQRLQYLTVHPHLSIKSRGAQSYMPMEIWDLDELKHLQVMGNDLPDSGDKSLGMLSTLLDVSMGSCTILSRLPSLKKLKIRIELSPDAADPLYFSDHISNLVNLESLKCVVMNPRCMLQVIPPVASLPILPSSLIKLSLSGLGCPWEEMKEISLLPSLQQLKLQCNAFQGRNWEVEELGFPSLYFLLMEDIDLEKWEGECGSFKSLKHLSIKHCYKLEKIQLVSFDDILNIEVVDSNPLAEKCIKEILLNGSTAYGLDISVYYSWKSARPSSNRRFVLRKF